MLPASLLPINSCSCCYHDFFIFVTYTRAWLCVNITYKSSLFKCCAHGNIFLRSKVFLMILMLSLTLPTSIFLTYKNAWSLWIHHNVCYHDLLRIIVLFLHLKWWVKWVVGKVVFTKYLKGCLLLAPFAPYAPYTHSREQGARSKVYCIHFCKNTITLPTLPTFYIL